MNDKNLDNLNSRLESELHGEQPGVPEKLSSREREGDLEQKLAEKRSATEKQRTKPSLHPAKRVAPPIPQMRDEVVIKIEKILESGLAEEYSKLSPIAKQEFKIKGEEVAEKIKEILSSTHIKVKKIFSLIVEWLRLLPGVNKFFLEQEAKIKTDHLIELHKKQQEKGSNKLI